MRSRCVDYANRLSALVSERVRSCDCALLSGGVDTTFVVLSHPRRNALKAITVDLGGSDARYARLVASKLGLKRHVVVTPHRGVFMEAVDTAVEMLKTIDPVEVAADAVHVISMRTALREGCNCVLSGDGGDELFLGYDFLLSLTEDRIREWINRMLKRVWLPTVWIGEKLGLRVIAPLYSDEAKELVKHLPLNCLIDRVRGYGKILLRLFIAESGLEEVAWRRKEPVTSGSGSLKLLKRLAESINIPVGRVREVLGFKPPSKLHSYLSWRLISKISPPPPCPDPSRRCPVCGRCLENGYCRFCGAYVESNGVTHHYVG